MKAKRAKNAALLTLVDKDHLSWKTLNQLINGPVFDQALRDLLNSYVPFEKCDLSPKSCHDSASALQKDCIELAGIKVPFLVSNGRVFLDMLAAFTVLGQLRLPLKVGIIVELAIKYVRRLFYLTKNLHFYFQLRLSIPVFELQYFNFT